jgi:hypothetical protein
MNTTYLCWRIVRTEMRKLNMNAELNTYIYFYAAQIYNNWIEGSSSTTNSTDHRFQFDQPGVSGSRCIAFPLSPPERIAFHIPCFKSAATAGIPPFKSPVVPSTKASNSVRIWSISSVKSSVFRWIYTVFIPLRWNISEEDINPNITQRTF